MGKSWGTEVVPREKWINPNNTYTSNGKRVVGLSMKLLNDCGREVTFPIKGSIVMREKPRKLKYMIWTLDGRMHVGKSSDYDLIEIIDKNK